MNYYTRSIVSASPPTHISGATYLAKKCSPFSCQPSPAKIDGCQYSLLQNAQVVVEAAPTHVFGPAVYRRHFVCRTSRRRAWWHASDPFHECPFSASFARHFGCLSWSPLTCTLLGFVSKGCIEGIRLCPDPTLSFR